ncbi:MAG TPA: cell wall hydrolase, partial [Thermaerobacter sp.]
IVNRVRSPRFPDSLRAVIFAPGQFPGVTEMIDEVRPGSSDLRAAKEALAGRDPSNGALYFYNPRVHRCDGEGDFLCNLKVTARIGNHVFAR